MIVSANRYHHSEATNQKLTSYEVTQRMESFPVLCEALPEALYHFKFRMNLT